MNSQEILENLVKLESNLQNIDTARKQVESLSNSYDATEKQLKKVALEIASIVKDLNVIFVTIKGNSDTISKELNDKVETVMQALTAKMTSIQTETDSIKKKFNKDCMSITDQLQVDVNSCLEAVQNRVVNVVSILNTKANEEIEKLLTTIQTFQIATKDVIVDYKTSMDGISSRFNADMQNHIASFNEIKQGLNQVLDTTKAQYQSLLNNVSEEVAKINSELKEYEVKLNSDLEGKFTGFSAMINLNSNKLDEIYNKITQEAGNITDTIKNGDVKQQQFLVSNFLNIETQVGLCLNDLNTVKVIIDSTTSKISKDIRANRKLIILLIIIASFSLLFNIVKFIL